MLPTQYRNQVVKAQARVVTGILLLHFPSGVDNFFLEVHDDPDNAPSDGPNMIRLDNFETVIKDIKDSYRE